MCNKTGCTLQCCLWEQLMQRISLIMEGEELVGMSTRKPPEPRVYREHA